MRRIPGSKRSRVRRRESRWRAATCSGALGPRNDRSTTCPRRHQLAAPSASRRAREASRSTRHESGRADRASRRRPTRVDPRSQAVRAWSPSVVRNVGDHLPVYAMRPRRPDYRRASSQAPAADGAAGPDAELPVGVSPVGVLPGTATSAALSCSARRRCRGRMNRRSISV